MSAFMCAPQKRQVKTRQMPNATTKININKYKAMNTDMRYTIFTISRNDRRTMKKRFNVRVDSESLSKIQRE